jgi:putative SOS response-associated peptidase YedK
MCNNYAVNVSWTEFLDDFAAQGLSLTSSLGAPNLGALSSIKPTDRAPVIRSRGPDSVELSMLSWGFPPRGRTGGPMINIRSEGRPFRARRCLVPASWFFEYSGATYPKAKWRFRQRDADWFCIAAIWSPDEGDGGRGETFSLVTLAPGPDIEPIHNRQVAIISPVRWRDWLDPTVPPEQLLAPSAAGSLIAECMTPSAPVQGSLF